jgi:ribosome modulation factor
MGPVDDDSSPEYTQGWRDGRAAKHRAVNRFRARLGLPPEVIVRPTKVKPPKRVFEGWVRLDSLSVGDTFEPARNRGLGAGLVGRVLEKQPKDMHPKLRPWAIRVQFEGCDSPTTLGLSTRVLRKP